VDEEKVTVSGCREGGNALDCGEPLKWKAGV